MRTTLTTDQRVFDSAIREIARRSGAGLDRVTDYEAGRVLSAAIRATPSAKVRGIRAGHENAKYTRVDGQIYNMSHRHSAPIWARIQAARRMRLKAKLGARGLTKASWLRLAQSLGLSADAPSFVDSARPQNGREYSGNFAAARLRSGGSYSLHFRNAAPTADTPAVRGRSIISRALGGREAYFRRSLRAGAFRTLAGIARAYPGVTAR